MLVEVHATAVNPLDVANAAGLLGTPLPMIPGGDYAGIVVSGGDHAGQEVWGSGPTLGMALGTKRPGTHARIVTLPETWLSRKPERLTMTEAGAIGRSYIATWQTVINTMDLEPGETILITGGAGMVGQAATAIARRHGAGHGRRRAVRTSSSQPAVQRPDDRDLTAGAGKLTMTPGPEPLPGTTWPAVHAARNARRGTRNYTSATADRRTG